MFKIISAAFIAASLFAAPAAFAEDSKMPRLITLSGHGEVKAKPDMAIVELGTVSQGQTAKAALEANTKAMTALLAMLKEAGLDDKDIQTSNFTVNPRYENSTSATGSPKIVGYDVVNGVTATVRKLDSLGALLDKAVSAGSNQVNGISFTVAEPQAAEDEARKAAVKDALRKASLLTEAAGVKLGPLSNMTEGAVAMPVPMAAQPRMMASAKMVADAPVPVAQGELVISADVNMVWTLE